jgi:hypothetical protein
VQADFLKHLELVGRGNRVSVVEYFFILTTFCLALVIDKGLDLTPEMHMCLELTLVMQKWLRVNHCDA